MADDGVAAPMLTLPEGTPDLDRRRFLKRVAAGSAVAWTAPVLYAGTAHAQGSPGPGVTTTTTTTTTIPVPPGYGPLGSADANGWLLPAGFTSRVIATSGQAVAGFTWPANPDGGAVFAAPGGGWIYVANSESGGTSGGASAIRFDSSANITSAYSILTGTNRNCAGGPTPWGTWLSCEEVDLGATWECDPFGVNPAVRRAAMGLFKQEAAAVDPATNIVYLTEDEGDSGLYRFIPTSGTDLSAGVLQVLTEVAGVLGWAAVPNPTPTAAQTRTRDQVATMKIFNRGEGAWFQGGDLFFVTTGDNRVWQYDPVANTIAVLSSPATNPELTGADNITGIASAGDLYVSEDGGDMQVVMVDAAGEAAVIAQLTGVAGSEVTGVAFDPSGTRLYLSSQRNPGRTYEITGPFRT